MINFPCKRQFKQCRRGTRLSRSGGDKAEPKSGPSTTRAKWGATEALPRYVNGSNQLERGTIPAERDALTRQVALRHS